MALNPVGSGSSLTVSTDTAKVIAAGIAQQSDTLRVSLVGASGMDGAHIKVGEMPTATTADYYLIKGESATINIHRPASQRVTGITTGATTVISCPEGTQMPFQIGDRVSIDGANFAHYNVLLSNVQVIGKSRSAGVGGDFAEKITVKADTSGITTAFDAGCHASLFLSNRVSVISPNPTAAAVVYIQQVQTTGSA